MGVVMFFSTKRLIHYSLHALDGLIGEVIDLYFDDEEWSVKYLCVDTGHWMPGRQILISTVSLLLPEQESRMLPVDLTIEQVRDSPSIELGQPVTHRQERELHDRYSWPVYWGNTTKPVTHPEPVVISSEQEESRENIRSGRDLIGFHVMGFDEAIGHVDDILLDASGWRIRYLVAGTRNILTVHETLLDVNHGVHVDWQEEQVTLDYTREAIRNAPPYLSPEEIDPVYETTLAEYFARNVLG